MLQKTLLRAALGFLFTVCAVAIPKAASANCLTDNLDSLPTDYGRKFTLTKVIGGGSWVSWSKGLTLNAGTSSYNFSTEYSDRFNGSQNFNFGSVDSEYVSSINSSTGAMTIHSNTWGSNLNVTLSCVNSTTATADTGGGGGLVIISFGGTEYIIP